MVKKYAEVVHVLVGNRRKSIRDSTAIGRGNGYNFQIFVIMQVPPTRVSFVFVKSLKMQMLLLASFMAGINFMRSGYRRLFSCGRNAEGHYSESPPRAGDQFKFLNYPA